MGTPEYEVTQEEMLAILRERVQRVHHMDLDSYIQARRSGTLKRTPADAALEVFAGDFGATRETPPRKKRVRGQGAVRQYTYPRDKVRPRGRTRADRAKAG